MGRGIRDWQRFDSLVDIDFAALALSERNMDALGLIRAPTWDELYAAVRGTVESYRRIVTAMDYVVVPETGGGRCLLYASVTGGVLDILTEEEVGAVAGSLILLSRSEPGLYYALPRQVFPPTTDGGYHAWNVLRHGPDAYIIDLSFHWIVAQNADTAGPLAFLVAKDQTLATHGLGYCAHDRFTRLVKPALKPVYVESLVRDALTRLGTALGGAAHLPQKRPSQRRPDHTKRTKAASS